MERVVFTHSIRYYIDLVIRHSAECCAKSHRGNVLFFYTSMLVTISMDSSKIENTQPVIVNNSTGLRHSEGVAKGQITNCAG